MQATLISLPVNLFANHCKPYTRHCASRRWRTFFIKFDIFRSISVISIDFMQNAWITTLWQNFFADNKSKKQIYEIYKKY